MPLLAYATLAEVFLGLLVILGLLLVFLSHWLATAALLPRFAERCEHAYRRPLVCLACLLIGTVVATPTLVGGFWLVNILPAPLKWIGIGIVAVPILLGLAGSTGLARRIGNGLPTPADADQPWRCVLRGGTVLVRLFLMPVIAQIFFIPLVLLTGIGASLISTLRPRSRTTEPVMSAEAPSFSAEPQS